jgi:citrate lyase beta subunit
MVAPHVLTLWTNDPALARDADIAGIDRIGLDLETFGKAARQAGRPTWISQHRRTDLALIKPVLQNAELFVRCNPIHHSTQSEVDEVIAAGATVLMLPNFTEVSQLEKFAQAVRGRARIIPLLERKSAESTLSAMPDLGITEFHVGLNDLSIDLQLSNRMSALASDLIERICAKGSDLGLRFGIGGLARAMDAQLPVPSDLVYAQHARLGASGALIARSFFNTAHRSQELTHDIRALRERLIHWQHAPKSQLDQARTDLLNMSDYAI